MTSNDITRSEVEQLTTSPYPPAAVLARKLLEQDNALFDLDKAVKQIRKNYDTDWKRLQSHTPDRFEDLGMVETWLKSVKVQLDVLEPILARAALLPRGESEVSARD
jgi:hypothetical protein